MEGLFECGHHVEDHVLVIVFFKAGEIEIGREPPLIPQEHFSQAGAALEGQSVQNAALGEELQQERQHNFLLRDHDVARSEEHTSELQSRVDLVCRLLLEKKKSTKC